MSFKSLKSFFLHYLLRPIAYFQNLAITAFGLFGLAGLAATREVVGMRLGFGSIKGDITLQANAVSGALLIQAGSNSIDSSKDPLGGVRWDGSTCAGGSTCTLKLSDLAGVKAGDASGASRDFFVSVLKTAVSFPTMNPALAASPAAQAGFWLNWRDRLNAVLK